MLEPVPVTPGRGHGLLYFSCSVLWDFEWPEVAWLFRAVIIFLSFRILGLLLGNAEVVGNICFLRHIGLLIHVKAILWLTCVKGLSVNTLCIRSSRVSGWDLAERWMRSSRWVGMRSSRVVRASDCHCQSRNCLGFEPSILRHSGMFDNRSLSSDLSNHT